MDSDAKKDDQIGAKEDYQSTRAEILQWQTARFTLITVSSALIVAILGIAIKDGSVQPEYYWAVSSLLLSFLLVAVLLTWYAGVANMKLGSYVAVFYEEKGKGWHKRQEAVTEGSKIRADKLRLDLLLSPFYILLGLASLSLSLLNPRNLTLIPLLLFTALLVFVIILFITRPNPVPQYRLLWRIIKNAEEINIDVSTKPFKNWLSDNKDEILDSWLREEKSDTFIRERLQTDDMNCTQRKTQSTVEKERKRLLEEVAKERKRADKLQAELEAERAKGFWQRLLGG